ncbi:MAG: hypothetical protein ACR2J4_11305, partial [Deinococcus sp.]
MDVRSLSRPRSPGGRVRRTALVAGAGLVLLLGGVLLAQPDDRAGQVAPGVRVEGVELGGLDRREALARLTAALGSAPVASVEVRAGSSVWRVPARRLGWSPDLAASAEAALRVRPTPLERFLTRLGRPPARELPLVQQV